MGENKEGLGEMADVAQTSRFEGKKSVYYNLQVVIEVLGFPGGSAGKESACNAGDLGSIPELGRSLGEGKGYTLQCFSLENSMDCISTGSQRVRHD